MTVGQEQEDVGTESEFRGVERAAVVVEQGLRVRPVRRTRFGGDSWELAEVPLNEEREAYRLDIYDGLSLARRVHLASPAYSYSAADQAAEFGGPATDFTVRITQLSAAVGPGYALQEAVHV